MSCRFRAVVAVLCLLAPLTARAEQRVQVPTFLAPPALGAKAPTVNRLPISLAYPDVLPQVQPELPLPVLQPSAPRLDHAYVVDEYTHQSGPEIYFPANAVTANAIKRMAAAEVSSRRDYCAHTMREALGWGLGDAHEWVHLTDRGFSRRAPGEAAQPGDIVVWPFTYGSHHAQHIGMAVGTDNGVRLLSNLCGHLGLSALVSGYVAFHKELPSAKPRPSPTPVVAQTPVISPGTVMALSSFVPPAAALP